MFVYSRTTLYVCICAIGMTGLIGMRICVPVLLLRLLNMFRDYIFNAFFIKTCHAKQCQVLVNGCHLVYSHFTQGVAKTQNLN